MIVWYKVLEKLRINTSFNETVNYQSQKQNIIVRME